MQRVVGVFGAAALAVARGAESVGAGVGGAGGRGVRNLLAAAAAVAVSAAAGWAEVRPVEPYYAVVTADRAQMRAQDHDIYYIVRELRQGEVLRVDGASADWLRVAYPSGTKAYVKAEDVKASPDGRSVELIRPSQLMAANVNKTMPWWPLLAEPLVAGTRLGDAEPVREPDGTLKGYLVVAPEGARGYLKPAQVRRATPEEAARAGGAAPAPSPAATTPAPASAAPPADTQRPQTAPPAESPAPAPVTPPAATPGQTPPAETGLPATGTTPEPAVPGTEAVAPPAPQAAPAPTKAINDLELLRDMFNRVMQSNGDETELDTVIREFERKIGALGDNPDDARVRRGLEQRLEALRLRAEVRESVRQARQRSGTIDDRARQAQEIVNQAERQAIYTIVGRLLPSTVYDGNRGLPLMYRIESADANSARTIGYVIPAEGQELLTKVGKVVGIVGQSRYDEALRLNIVAPRRIDVLNVGTSSRPAATPPAEPDRQGETDDADPRL